MDLSKFMPLLMLVRGGGDPMPMMRQMFGDAQVSQISQMVQQTPADQRGQLVQQFCQQHGINPTYAKQVAQMLGVSF